MGQKMGQGAKRPLAVAGLGFLAVLFFACRATAGTVLLVAFAALLLLAAVLALRAKGAVKTMTPVLLLCAALVALMYLALFLWLGSGPVERLAGSEAKVSALVTDITPGYGEDTQNATLYVRSVESGQWKGNVRPFRVMVNSLTELSIGDEVTLKLRFSGFTSASARAQSFAKGRYVRASARTVAVVTGQSDDILCAARRLRYRAGDTILEKLPVRLSGIVAAMAVGDRRFLPLEAVKAYRMAGLSHMLVVSGMHMSILCGAAYFLLQKLLRRRTVASAASMALVLAFMVFTGFTPSVVRSGVGCLLVLSAPFFSRQADLFTSLGLSAVLLCLQNPFAAADAGVLLSFTSTIGVYAGARFGEKRFALKPDKKAPFCKHAGRNLCVAALSSAAATLAMLPVLAWADMGVSLATVPANIIAVPLLAPIVIIGLVMALSFGGAVWSALLAPFVLAEGAMLVFLEKLTGFCAAHPALYLGLGGALALTVVLVVYAALALALKVPKYRAAYAAGAVLLAALGVGLSYGMARGTVTVSVAGSGASSSLVVAKGTEAAVIYRGRLSANAVERALTGGNIAECTLFIDLRKTAQSTEYVAMFSPRQVVTAREDFLLQDIFTPFDGVDIYVQNQTDGSVACVDVAGYKIAIASGGVELGGNAPVDVFVAGTAEAGGDFAKIIVGGEAPGWAGDSEVLLDGGEAQVVVRPGKSVLFRDVSGDLFGV